MCHLWRQWCMHHATKRCLPYSVHTEALRRFPALITKAIRAGKVAFSDCMINTLILFDYLQPAMCSSLWIKLKEWKIMCKHPSIVRTVTSLLRNPQIPLEISATLGSSLIHGKERLHASVCLLKLHRYLLQKLLLCHSISCFPP